MAKTKVEPSRTPRSLAQFVLDKKRKGCPVCALPEHVRVEITESKGRKIPRAVILEWLQQECHIKVTTSDFDRHYSARHESEV